MYVWVHLVYSVHVPIFSTILNQMFYFPVSTPKISLFSDGTLQITNQICVTS